mgnify:CR=1 FL=1
MTDQIVCLIKPQFEAGREKSASMAWYVTVQCIWKVIEKLIDFAISIGFEVLNLEFSPVKGPEGNIEYLLHLQKHTEGSYTDVPFEAAQVVEKAHAALD